MKALYGAGRVRTDGGVSKTIKDGINSHLKPLAEQIKPLRERVLAKKEQVKVLLAAIDYNRYYYIY